MKGRICVLLLAVMYLGCTSCNKDIPGAPDAEGQDVTIRTVFNVEEAVATRSDANDDEQKIRNKMILVFNAAGKCIGLSTADTVKARSGEKIKIVGIANPEIGLVTELDSQFNAEKLTYSSLGSFVTKQELEASQLIKIGVIDTTLVPTVINPEVKIPVVQLPARITVEIEVSGSNGETFEAANYVVEGVATSSLLSVGLPALKSAQTKSTIGWISGYMKNTEKGTTNKVFYTYKKETSTDPINIKISGNLIKNEKTEFKTYSLKLNPTASNGGTDGILPGYAYTVTGKINSMTGLDISVTVVPMASKDITVDYGKKQGV